jgi:hypothetical protein
MGGDSCFSRAASLRRWQRGVQQLFQSGGSRGPDTGDRRKLGGVSTQQVMQAAKPRAYSARGGTADARQGQHDLHLLLGQRGPAPPSRRAVSRIPDLALFCCTIDKVRRICRSAAGQDRHVQDSGDVRQRPADAFRAHLGVTDAQWVTL